MQAVVRKHRWWCGFIVLFTCLATTPALAQFVPPKNLNPATASIQLDSSYQSDAWLVYTYDIDANGQVANATIQSSNGVLDVEQAVLRQVNAMRFSPATRNGKPIKVSAEPVIYTWILDKPRELSPDFDRQYREAWALYSENNYDGAFDIALALKDYPGRNALEEVKFQTLAASLASRWKDEAAELQHLSRIVEFQNLALNNNFNNTYVPAEQFLQILNRIVTLQLNRMMLADAGDTLLQMQRLGGGSEITADAGQRFVQAQRQFDAMPDVTVNGELVPLFRDGPGSWKTGLSRSAFSLSDVRGRVSAVFLVCTGVEKQLRYPSREPWVVPAGWNNCKVDISGKAGTQLVLHQYVSG